MRHKRIWLFEKLSKTVAREKHACRGSCTKNRCAESTLSGRRSGDSLGVQGRLRNICEQCGCGPRQVGSPSASELRRSLNDLFRTTYHTGYGLSRVTGLNQNIDEFVIIYVLLFVRFYLLFQREKVHDRVTFSERFQPTKTTAFVRHDYAAIKWLPHDSNLRRVTS